MVINISAANSSDSINAILEQNQDLIMQIKKSKTVVYSWTGTFSNKWCTFRKNKINYMVYKLAFKTIRNYKVDVFKDYIKTIKLILFF